MSNTTLTKHQLTLRDWIMSPVFKSQIDAALPSICTSERFVRAALTSMQKNPKLMQCTQASLFQSFMTAAQLGIEPDGRRAHLIPYGTECTLVIDYKGLVELVKRSGDVSVPYAEKVCENDFFQWENGDIVHRIDFTKPRGNAYAYYARVRHKDGAYQAVVMTKDEVEAIRARSRGRNSEPWTEHFDEMGKKTAFRRLSKWLVLSPEVADGIEKAEHSEFGGGVEKATASAADALESALKADGEVVPTPEAEDSKAFIEAEREKARAKAKQAKEKGELGIETPKAATGTVLPD